MKRIIFSYGALAGAIVISSMILGFSLGDAQGVSASQWLGYLIMLVALSLIFLGIKRYRDRQLGGVIKFGTALLLGLGISIVASLIYVTAWEAYLSLTDYAFIDDYAQTVVAAKEAEGLAGAELEAEAAKLESFKEQYANPMFRLPMTFLEIFPVGLLITLLAATLLRKSNFMPA
ncbi:MAG: DUF4199 domain-containing protein [Acidobacteria bacterium]|nr:DUF4199 domain-containing protein [Acidobacteriota bacterium]